MTMAKRLKGMGQAKYQRDGDPRTSGPGFGITEHPAALRVPLTWRKPRKVFVNSMSDLFHDGVSDEFIGRVWQVMGTTPEHSYQILTKRHGRMRSWVNRWYAGEIAEPYAVRPVNGFPGYSVTTHGEVLGKRRDTVGGLSEDVGEQGHRRVTMHRDDSPRNGERALVHRLVLETFARPAYDSSEQACHRNGDPSDNRLSNLYWGTQQDNWRDRIRHGNGRSYAKLNPEDVAEIRRRCNAGESAYRVAQDYPVSDTQIRNVVRGTQWATSQPAAVAHKPCRAVLSSVWLGVSAEDQKSADLRIPALLDTLAAVRFVSAEPLIGPIDLHGPADAQGHRARLTYWLTGRPGWGPDVTLSSGLVMQTMTTGPHLDWLILGGESGPGARPMELDWARSLVRQCQAFDVAVFVKQLGSIHGRALGGGKGGDPDFWPDGLNVREFPAVTG